MRLGAAAVLAAATVISGCGRKYVGSDEVAACLAADGIATRLLGDSSDTPVLSFEIPASSTPARGLLIVAGGFSEVETLEEGIAAEARALGDVAHLLREGNVLAHFLTNGPPRRRDEDRVRRCLG